MPFTEMVVSVAVVSAIVLGVIAVLRLIGTIVTHATIRKIVAIDPSRIDTVLTQITAPRESFGDDRIGVVLIAIGLAMIGASLTAGNTGGWTDYGIGGALFPLLTGIALCLRQFIVARMRRRAGGQ
jgi:hypothetical protein